MHKRNLLSTALIVPALFALEVFGGSPIYSPQEGATLTKRFESTAEITLDDMTMVVNGQDMSGMLNLEMDTSATIVTQVTDHYAAVSSGRPAKLERTFDTLSSKTHVSSTNPMTGDMDVDMEGSSDLEGESVVFQWNDDDGAYAVKYAEGSDGDSDLLEGLDEDMDLELFLPSETVSEGDEWEVSPNAMRAVFAPGGATGIEAEENAANMGMGGTGPSNFGEFLEDFDGAITAKFKEVREEGDTHVAVIELSVECSSAADMTEWMQDMLENADMPEGMDVEMTVDSFDLEFSFEGEGELLWDLDENLPFGLNLSGDVEQAIDTSMVINAGGMEQAMEQSMSFSGTQTIQMTTGE
ncbi:MAG TPA: hypothetical protein ENJ09_07035 [Planctomycetes bacterium]|nr:hypothetical protein [Planctomycetota bacterium]